MAKAYFMSGKYLKLLFHIHKQDSLNKLFCQHF